MAKILSDRDIKKLIGSIIENADEKYLNPNSIELRLGKKVRFLSTKEEKDLKPGEFLQVNPGENVIISSLEKIDFTSENVQKIYPDSNFMGFITPTTTMMREGISQVTTKIDSGFRGTLNWSLRNSSINTFIIQYSEPIYKLTIFLLDKDESPELVYGKRPSDTYQDSKGIVVSTRRIPADIPKDKIVSSSIEKFDPKKQLKEAGYPFNHIGTELVTLHGKFEIVSKDVALLKDEIEKRTSDLSKKIENETSTLSNKLEEFRDRFFEQVESIFERKFIRIGSVLIGLISIMYSGLTFLTTRNVSKNIIMFVAAIVGIAIISIALLLGKKKV